MKQKKNPTVTMKLRWGIQLGEVGREPAELIDVSAIANCGGSQLEMECSGEKKLARQENYTY